MRSVSLGYKRKWGQGPKLGLRSQALQVPVGDDKMLDFI